MSGRSALLEVMSGSLDVMQLGDAMKEMEAAMAEPMDDTALESLLENMGKPPRRLKIAVAMILKPVPKRFSPAWESGLTTMIGLWNPLVADGKCASLLQKF